MIYEIFYIKIRKKSSKMNITYSKGEIVWAKISGFPWWPAVIRGIYLKRKTKEQNGTLLTRYDPNPTFLIEFYPDHSHCEISSDKIEKFEHTFLERASTKKKSLIKAIDLAKKDIFKKMKFSSHILYDILGKKRYRERKRSIARNKKRKTTKLSSMFNSEEGEKKEKIQKVIFDDDSEDENEQKKKSNISSQTVSMDHSDDEDNYEEISEERIIKKIQNHLDSLLRIKIEMRGKEAHKQIMSSLDKLSRIFARKNFSLNFDSVNYIFI